jgi:hypothetical protein
MIRSSTRAPVQERNDKTKLRIVSGPFTLGTLTLWGVIIFVAGFIHGTQLKTSPNALETKALSAPPLRRRSQASLALPH